jgi:PIN domain nuclease of toxin-antitoxin system
LVGGVAAVIYVDTHIVVWIFSGRTDLLSHRALEAIENEDLLISPIVSLELQYLFEINRITQQSHTIIKELSRAVGLSLCNQPFDKIVAEANRMHWTRDPFDRIITANASLGKNLLLTKDTSILSHYKWAFWK